MHYHLSFFKVATCCNHWFLQTILTPEPVAAVYCSVIAVLFRVGTGKVKQVSLSPLCLRIHSIHRKTKQNKTKAHVTDTSPAIYSSLKSSSSFCARWIKRQVSSVWGPSVRLWLHSVGHICYESLFFNTWI